MTAEPSIDHDIDASSAVPIAVDRIAGDLAEAQHTVVARRQLLRAGVGRGAVAHRLAQGRWRFVHPGVYAVGHAALTREGRFMAATLAAGDDALLSHRSAAALLAIRAPAGPAIEVTVPLWRANRRGLLLRQARIADDERTAVDGIAVTTVARTLLDLAAVLPPDRLERAMHEAEILGARPGPSVPVLLARHPGRRGVAKLRALLADAALGADVTDSELEDLFVAFLDAHGFGRPLLNRLVLGFRVDAIWPAYRVAVELDGGVHRTRRRFESDRSRDRALLAAGWRVVRITWRQLHDEPAALAADLRRILARAAA